MLHRPVESGQFRSKKVIRLLKNNGLRGSMGRVASAGDNAAMESWHALLQKNVLDRRRWRTRDELHEAIVFWTEHTTTAGDVSAGSASAPRSSSNWPSSPRPQPLRHDHHSPGVNRPCSSPVLSGTWAFRLTRAGRRA